MYPALFVCASASALNRKVFDFTRADKHSTFIYMERFCILDLENTIMSSGEGGGG